MDLTLIVKKFFHLMIDKVGRAGSLERVEALAKHYQNTEEKSPFFLLTD